MDRYSLPLPGKQITVFLLVVFNMVAELIIRGSDKTSTLSAALHQDVHHMILFDGQGAWVQRLFRPVIQEELIRAAPLTGFLVHGDGKDEERGVLHGDRGAFPTHTENVSAVFPPKEASREETACSVVGNLHPFVEPTAFPIQKECGRVGTRGGPEQE